MLNFLKRPTVRAWLLLVLGAALPWAVSAGLWYYGTAVPESVYQSTWDQTAMVSFFFTAVAGFIV